ncbi:PaaI family thioesterase [Paracoccaceae bacterium GXU_MW_L88]
MSQPFPDETGAQQFLGYQIVIDPVRVSLKIEDQHRNRYGALHGGLISTLLDTVCGMTCAMAAAEDPTDPTRFATVSLTVNFMASANEGEVVAEAEITGGGKKIKFVDAVLRGEDGTKLATAQAVMRQLSI